MNFRIKRRRFGQLAIATTTATIVANLTGRTVAQQTEVIYGVTLASTTKTKQLSKQQVSDISNSTPATVIISSDVVTGNIRSTFEVPAATVENLQTPTETASKGISTEPSERLTGLTTLSDGTFIVSSVASSKNGDTTRLIFIDSKSSKLKKGSKLSGFKKKNSTIESLLATKDGKLLSVISLNAGVPPFDLAVIDPQNGKVTSGNELALPAVSPKQRLSNLTQSPDGKVHAIILGREKPPTLVQLDLEYQSPATGRGKIIQLVELKFKNNSLGNDLLSLAFSPLGQLFALANLDNEKINSLFTVDVKTGELSFIRKFDVNKIAFASF